MVNNDKLIDNHFKTANACFSIFENHGTHYVKIKVCNDEIICKIKDLKRVIDQVVDEKKRSENIKTLHKPFNLLEDLELSLMEKEIPNRILGQEDDAPLKKTNKRAKVLTQSLEAALQEAEESGDKSILKNQIAYVASQMEGLDPDDEVLETYNQILRKCLNNTLSEKKVEAIKTLFKAAVKSGAQDSDALKATIEDEVNKLNKQNKTHSFEINGKLYVITKITAQNNSKFIQIAQRTDRFANGSNGSIFNVKYFGILPKPTDIMKIARDDEEAREDLLNEKAVLDYIHKDGKKVGIQDSPHTVIQCSLGGESILGYIAPKYEMDGWDLIYKSNELGFMDVKTKVNLTNNLIKGLESIHSLNLYHGDIKTENMLYRKNELVISDFGGAREFSNLILLDDFPDINDIFGTCTDHFVSDNIFQEIESILEKNEKRFDATTNPEAQKKILEKMLKKEIAPLLRKNDQFALGLALYSFWMIKDSPFKYDKITNSAIVKDNSLGDIYDELDVSTPNDKIRDVIFELLCQGLGSKSFVAH